MFIFVADVIVCYRSKWKKVPTGSIIVFSLLAVSYFTPYGSEMSMYLKLYQSEGEYINIVNNVIGGQEGACDWSCVIDYGPPVRVAFSWGGFNDNWSGICYDPTGIVLQADNSYSNSIRGMFGGDLIATTHLWNDWYYCAFT